MNELKITDVLNERIEVRDQRIFVGQEIPNDGKYPRWGDHPYEWRHWNKTEFSRPQEIEEL